MVVTIIDGGSMETTMITNVASDGTVMLGNALAHAYPAGAMVMAFNAPMPPSTPSVPMPAPMPMPAPTNYGNRPTYHEWAEPYAKKWGSKWQKSWTEAKTKELKKRSPRAPRSPRSPQPPRHPRPPAPPHKWYGNGMMPRLLKEQASEKVFV